MCVCVCVCLCVCVCVCVFVCVCVCVVGLWCVDCVRAAYLVISLPFAHSLSSLPRSLALVRYAAETGRVMAAVAPTSHASDNVKFRFAIVASLAHRNVGHVVRPWREAGPLMPPSAFGIRALAASPSFLAKHAARANVH